MNALRVATIILLPTLSLAAVVLTAAVKPLQAAASALPTASVAGIMVNYPIADDVEGMPTLAFQGTFSGTRLAIVVDSPGGGIIGFNRDTSKVTRFEDSTGKSLMGPSSPFGPFAYGDRIVQGARRIALELESREAPAEGASSVLATGTIDIAIAHEKRTYQSQPTSLTGGAAIEAGPFKMTVKSFEPSSWDGGFELRVITRAPLAEITRITAILKDGQRVPLDQRSTMSFNGTTDLTLACDTDLGGAAAIEIQAWHDAKIRHVPFKVEASAGLK